MDGNGDFNFQHIFFQRKIWEPSSQFNPLASHQVVTVNPHFSRPKPSKPKRRAPCFVRGLMWKRGFARADQGGGSLRVQRRGRFGGIWFQESQLLKPNTLWDQLTFN